MNVQYRIVLADRMHEAVEEAMTALLQCDEREGESQTRHERFKDAPFLIHVRDVAEITISKAMPTDLYGLVEYELEFIEGVRDHEKALGYTYHSLYGQFLEKCVEELKRDETTRRAVLPVAGEMSYGSPHPPCLQDIMFRIDGGKLNTTAIFRSNDGVKAFAMNMFVIVRLAHRIAAEVGVGVGWYTHIANSFHAYRNDWDMLEGYTKRFRAARDGNVGLYYTINEYMAAYREHAGCFLEKCLGRKGRADVG